MKLSQTILRATPSWSNSPNNWQPRAALNRSRSLKKSLTLSLRKLKLQSSLTSSHQNRRCMMQPGEANRFSMHNNTGAAKMGDGSQVTGIGKNVTSLSQVPNNSSSALLLPVPGHPVPGTRDPARTRNRTPDPVGYLMVLPYLLHITIFLGYPLAFAFVLIF